ncbi:ubiquitin-like modifier-activating enzyme 7 [Sorex araneus]|uniref:ubiquitin-like modifier-activating enzyme 7 n=1 Tax=Sorex araneus TaxID=42254 RepID=UPI002433B3C6|nr:ubiquitin-like modifier-activating enzyme 7 [Sorex araneus]
MDGQDTSPQMDEQLYSRQLYVLGLPAMQRVRKAKVLLSGLQGLGAEVAKNLALMGVGSLTLHDPHPTHWTDLAAQFFLSERDLQKNRAEACQKSVAELNSEVQVSVHKGDLTEDLLKASQVVVLTNAGLEEQLKVGTFCHKYGIYFLVADTRGLVGHLFCDFGEQFIVEDPTEEEPLKASIQHISQGNPGILTLQDDSHHFQEVDRVTFSGVEGMVELNGCDPHPLHVQEDGTFKIGDTSFYSQYLRGGLVIEVKRAQTVSHKPLDVALLQPQVVAKDTQRALCLHQTFRALHQFQHERGHPPQPWNSTDAEEVVGLLRTLEPLRGPQGEPLQEPWDEGLVRRVALSSAGVLSPMAAVLGALTAQEVLKAITRKFKPLDQWLYFDALDCLPEDEEAFPRPEDCAPSGCRYDGQTAVFGAGFQEKLRHQHYLLVGAGAIGCELLKGFALMGLGTGDRGGVTVTDPDHVELSNLSRQFLFRSQDISRPKAEVAAEAARRLNPDLRVTPYTRPLNPSTENIFGDRFFSDLDGVAAALDSFEARHYMAARCNHNLKPLLEAGTLGTRGSASVFVPHKTEQYTGPRSDASAEGGRYPVCTVKHFPSRTEHTVVWARELFEKLFYPAAEIINQQQPADTQRPQPQELQEVLGELRQRPQTWQDCVVWALGCWHLHFHSDIQWLLRFYPPDKVSPDGMRFWSPPKQCPQPLKFDASQDMHLLFVLAAANLYAQMHELTGSPDQAALKDLLKTLPLPDAQHQAPVFTSDLELAQVSSELGTVQPRRKRSRAWEDWSQGPSLKTLMFNKDDDSNFHVDFVTAAASLRAQNYGIQPANKAQSKQILGQIIPAIATTTAAVAGLLGLELYKVVDGSRPLHAFRHSYLHMAENSLHRQIPSAPAIQTFQNWKWTCWDRVEVSAGQPERTLESLLTHLQERHGVRVRMLLHDTAYVYSARWPPEKRDQYLSRSVTEVMREMGWEPKPGQQVLELELSCEGEEDDTTFPPLHYQLWPDCSTAPIPPTPAPSCMPSPGGPQ